MTVNPASSIFRAVAAAVFLIVMVWGATSPSSLFVVYRQTWGITNADIAIVFSVYVGSLLPALLFLGSIAEKFGRRPVLFAGLALMAVGLGLLAIAHSLPMLLVARFFQGAGVGLTVGLTTAAFAESYRGTLPSGGAIQAISALGLMGGPVLSAIFFNLGGGVNWSYVPTLLLVVALVAIVPFIPQRALNANAKTVDVPLAPEIVRSGLRFAIPVVFVSWAGLGLFFSLVPAYLATSLHADNPAIGALAVVAAQLSSLAAVFGFGAVAPSRSGLLAPAVMIAGLVALVAGTTLNIWPLVIAATILVGAGGGVAAAAAFAIAGRIAVGQRTRIFARMYVSAYLGYTVPTLAVGIIAVHSSLFVGFSVVTIVIGLITAALPALRERSARAATITPYPAAA